ncbi:TadE/TadG family type IV pilus assembly protein [Paraoerskovia marina]|uniref:TadE/TadG family type IV pilus assembly protein n=1 Tax=Paraoerskovia marina TaxID=545619 RepID=UPI000492B021|nr:TadE/TadG family type IV pilus assembly protein [Paraoerskovia marina]
MAEFALVSVLVLALVLAVVQVILAVYVRSLLVDAAAEGARVAARADSLPSDGIRRTEQLIEGSLSGRFAEDVRVSEAEFDGLPVTEISVRAPFPVVGTLGPSGMLEVQGHAVQEPG